MSKSYNDIPAIPAIPIKAQRVDCYLEINGVKNSFWLDFKCSPRRIKNCLYETLGFHPGYTKLFLNDVELTEEKSIVDFYEIKNNDIIKVTTDDIVRALISGLNGTILDKIKIYQSDECVSCLEKLTKSDKVTFIPCGHRCICIKCYEKITQCPLCNNKS